jgi:uncharacterized protein
VLSSSILNIFASSPIKPMQKHMAKIIECVLHLQPFFSHVLKGDWGAAKDSNKDIVSLEAEADNLKKEIRLHLPNSLFMPVARTDLLGLLASQDKIANKAKHISGLVLGRKMAFPGDIADKLAQFVQSSIDAPVLAQKAINELDDLVEVGFKGREVKIVEDMILELDKVERNADNLQMELRAQLFDIEKDINPIDAIFFYKIIDWIAEMADRAQHVGHRIESLLAR